MKLNQLTPNLMVEDVNQTLEYYQKMFDFKVVASVPESGQFDWAMTTSGEVTLMFQTRQSLGSEIPDLMDQPFGGGLTLYLDVEDVEGWWARLKDRTTVVQTLHTAFYGRKEFAVKDPNGYILSFSEEVR